jgi:hypothetical protein
MSAPKIHLKKIALGALWALTLALLVLSLGWMPLARATDLGKPLILVAKPDLAGTLFRASVLVVAPVRRRPARRLHRQSADHADLGENIP